MLSTLDKVRGLWNPGLELEGILLTMVDTRTSLMQQVESEVPGSLWFKVYRTLVPRNIRLSEAPSHGLPIMKYDPASRADRMPTASLPKSFSNSGGLRQTCRRRPLRRKERDKRWTSEKRSDVDLGH